MTIETFNNLDKAIFKDVCKNWGCAEHLLANINPNRFFLNCYTASSLKNHLMTRPMQGVAICRVFSSVGKAISKPFRLRDNLVLCMWNVVFILKDKMSQVLFSFKMNAGKNSSPALRPGYLLRCWPLLRNRDRRSRRLPGCGAGLELTGTPQQWDHIARRQGFHSRSWTVLALCVVYYGGMGLLRDTPVSPHIPLNYAIIGYSKLPPKANWFHRS